MNKLSAVYMHSILKIKEGYFNCNKLIEPNQIFFQLTALLILNCFVRCETLGQ